MLKQPRNDNPVGDMMRMCLKSLGYCISQINTVHLVAKNPAKPF